MHAGMMMLQMPRYNFDARYAIVTPVDSADVTVHIALLCSMMCASMQSILFAEMIAQLKKQVT